MTTALTSARSLAASLLALGFLAGGANAAVVQLGGTSSENFWPFSAAEDFDFGSGLDRRYQVSYDTSRFAGISGPIQITGISFMAGAGYLVPVSYSNTSISLTLSSSPLDAGAQSAVFASNVGADATVVFDGAISGSAAAVGDLLVFNFSTNFLYDPSLGFDLLVDVLPTGSASGRFSALNDETITRVYSRSGTEAGSIDSSGLSAVVSYELVPEPSAAVLLGLGSLALAFRRSRR
jgi:hypothetical protein